MPWSGGSFTRTNGVHTGSTLWVQDRDAGTKILATRHDTHDQDLADGINSTLEKSGSNAATGDLDIGSNRITLTADGTATQDVATINQLQNNAPAFQATDTGTANAYVIALSPAVTAYAAGQAFTFKAANASTTASTLNVNTIGTKAIKKLNDQDIASGDIESGSIVSVVYDGTSFQMTSQLASSATTSPGGSNTQVQYNSSGAFAGSANLTFDTSTLTVTGTSSLDGAVTVNDTGADVDLRVESNNNANAFVMDGGTLSGTGQGAFGGVVDTTASWLFDRQAFTHAAGTSYSTVRINRTGAVTIPSGTAPIVSSLSVSEPHITATGTVTDAATVYVVSAPTEGSNNYALLVGAGNALIAGSVTSSTQVVGNTTGNPSGVVLGKSTNASQTNSNVRTESDKAADNNFTAITCEVDTDGTPNLIFRVGGGGVVTADGSITGCGADYQELFETVSGERYPLGKTIVLVDGKVALAEDNPSLPVMGVTRPSEDEDHRGGVVVGNSAWNHWSKKYNKDVHGVYEREDVEVIEWTENGEKKSKYKKNIPEGKMPSEHTTSIHSVRKLNPAFEKDRDYVPRGYRKEWQAIGIVGQVPILDGQRVDDRWVDMGNLAPGVNKWLVR